MTHVRYIDRTREYYLSQGYEKPYAWSENDQAPFTPLTKPLSESNVGLLTTSELAVRYDADRETNPIEETGFRSVYSIPADTPLERFYARTASFDTYATTLDDVNGFFPVARAREAVADGRIGTMPSRYYGAYNNYSRRKVLEEEAPDALNIMREDNVDAAILVPV